MDLFTGRPPFGVFVTPYSTCSDQRFSWTPYAYPDPDLDPTPEVISLETSRACIPFEE